MEWVEDNRFGKDSISTDACVLVPKISGFNVWNFIVFVIITNVEARAYFFSFSRWQVFSCLPPDSGPFVLVRSFPVSLWCRV